jgi:hypothetical protein
MTEEMQAADTRPLKVRLLKIQAELERVPRRGERYGSGNKFMYDFATHDDVVEAVRPAFNNEGILVTSQVLSSEVTFREVGSKTVCFVVVQEEVTLSIPGEELSFRSVGAASGEATAVGVARSYAKKYALINFLLIQQGDEADLETSEEEEPVQQPRSRSASKADPPHTQQEEGNPRGRSSDVGANIKKKDWEEVNDTWHKKGSIPPSQLNRLIKAAKANGWEEDEVKMLIQDNLHCSIEDIPFGTPYNVLVEIFSQIEPNRD